MDLGRKLRELRRRRKLSLADVEQITGLHFSTIGKYERNLRRPNLDVLRELAAVYHVPLGELVSEAKDVIDLLPNDLRTGARLLAQRADLARLVSLAGALREDQVSRLADFLESLLGANPATGFAAGAAPAGADHQEQPQPN